MIYLMAAIFIVPLLILICFKPGKKTDPYGGTKKSEELMADGIEPLSKWTEAYNGFALSLLCAASPYDNNFVISPFSLGSALVLVLDGAKGDTQNELIKLLGKTLLPSDISDFYSSLISDFSQKNADVVARSANRFYLDRQFSLSAAYLKHIKKAYGASAENINFSDGAASAELVNSFVRENTEGKIAKVVSSDSFSGTVALIVNATYFNGAWLIPFDPLDTKKMPFKGIGGRREEEFMFKSSYYTYSSVSPELSIVTLPYKDPAYSLVVLMPSGDFGKWRAGLTAEKLNAAMSSLHSGNVDLTMPKFSQRSSTDGKSVLQKLQVSRLFESVADLSGISTGRGLIVSAIQHKASIEISELGTEAAASTCCYSVLSPPEDIKFDHPFLYLIVRDDLIIFIGQHV